jgi:hypothetical protein
MQRDMLLTWYQIGRGDSGWTSRVESETRKRKRAHSPKLGARNASLREKPWRKGEKGERYPQRKRNSPSFLGISHEAILLT